MGMAFGVSVDDVAAVLKRHGSAPATEAELDNLFSSLDEERIEQAALYGNDMDEQTDYAQAEIAVQLKEHGFLS